VLAKLGSPSIVGQFTLGLAVSAPVFMFTNLQLRAVQATDVNVEHGFANYFTLRLLATLLGLIVVVALLPFAGASSAVRVCHSPGFSFQVRRVHERRDGRPPAAGRAVEASRHQPDDARRSPQSSSFP